MEDTGSLVQGRERLDRPHWMRSGYLKTPGQEEGKETMVGRRWFRLTDGRADGA